MHPMQVPWRLLQWVPKSQTSHKDLEVLYGQSGKGRESWTNDCLWDIRNYEWGQMEWRRKQDQKHQKEASICLRLFTGSKALSTRHMEAPSPLSLASHSCSARPDIWRFHGTSLLHTLCLLPARHSCFPEAAQFLKKWHLRQLLFLRSYIKIMAKQKKTIITESSVQRGTFEALVSSLPPGLSCLLPLPALHVVSTATHTLASSQLPS